MKIEDKRLVLTVEGLTEVRPTLVSSRDDDGTMFLTYTGIGFSPDLLTRWVRQYVEAAGLQKAGACHLFRHTMATLMLERGADIRFVQEMLGHAHLQTTQIYTRVAIKKLKRSTLRRILRRSSNARSSPIRQPTTKHPIASRHSSSLSCSLLNRGAKVIDVFSVDRTSELACSLPKTRIRASRISPAIGTWSEPALTRSSHQSWSESSTTLASEYGKYTQTDPLALAGGINLYEYARSNPTGLIDPRGLLPEVCHETLCEWIAKKIQEEAKKLKRLIDNEKNPASAARSAFDFWQRYDGHLEQFENRKRALEKWRKRWRDENCDGPPPNPFGMAERNYPDFDWDDFRRRWFDGFRRIFEPPSDPQPVLIPGIPLPPMVPVVP